MGIVIDIIVIVTLIVFDIYGFFLVRRYWRLSDDLKEFFTVENATVIGQSIIISTLATLGAKDLKELGYKKEQINQINMARTGVKAMGHQLGDGLGVNDLIGQVSGAIPQGMGDGEGGMDIKGMIMQMIMGKFMGGGQPKEGTKDPLAGWKQ
jgi:hypothetical protein